MYLFTDLDNTVLYSHRHEISDPVVWIEKLNGHDQSYMTEAAYYYYLHQKWLKVVPVTTRTPQQYSRLQEGLGRLGWNEALVCNGAIRLVNGREDPEWTKASMEMAEPYTEAFHNAYRAAVTGFVGDLVVLVEPFMFYVKGADAEAAYSTLREYAGSCEVHLTILRDSRKVYCIPGILNKGTAVRRYRRLFGMEPCIAAGDSEFDIPMLQEADISLCPEALSDYPSAGVKIICPGRLSDQICRELDAFKRLHQYT